MARKSAAAGDAPVTRRRSRAADLEVPVTEPDPAPPVESLAPSADITSDPGAGVECFHGGTAPERRTVQVRSATGDWFSAAFADLAPGTVFRLFEPDGTPAGDGREWVATSDPYRLNAEEDRFAVDCRAPDADPVATVDAALSGPLQVGESVWLRSGSGMLTVKTLLPWTFDDAGKESADGTHRHVVVVNPDGSEREWDEALLTRTPTPVADEAPPTPVDEEEDPVEAALARARPTLPEDVANAMRALWAGDRMIEAIALYRRSVQPEPTLAEAKLATEYIVGEGAAPEGFDLAAFLGTVEEPTPEARAEVVQLFEADPPKPKARPALKVAPKPPPRTGREIIGRRTTEVEFDLTDDELREHGQRMAHLHMEMVAEEARQAGLKKEMRERLAGLKGEIAREAGIVEKRKEVRAVVVYMEADFGAGVVRDVLLAGTVVHRVVSERPITPDERQLPLFPVGEDASGSPTASTAAPEPARETTSGGATDEGSPDLINVLEPGDADDDDDEDMF